MYPHPSGSGTSQAAAPTARSPAPPTTRRCLSASIRCSSTRWPPPTGSRSPSCSRSCSKLGIAEAEYDAYLINIGDGDQFGSGFVALNPNSKIPALADHSTSPPTRVFESGSILLYLAEKFGALLPTEPRARTECLSWLFFQMGSAPYIGGGFGHFYAFNPDKIEYCINRFAMETKRLLDVLNQRLAENRFLTGDDYTIADIANYGWYGALLLHNLYDAAEFLDVASYTHAVRWAGEIDARPAVQRGRRGQQALGTRRGPGPGTAWSGGLQVTQQRRRGCRRSGRQGSVVRKGKQEQSQSRTTLGT